MKRVTEEVDVNKKKRVRFDPDVKDNSSAVSNVPTRAIPRRTKSSDVDSLDILGRPVNQHSAGPSTQSIVEESDEIKAKKHTLDSDEEEDIPEPKKLDIRSVHGQEKQTIDYDGSVKIMPFNMDEENEEGHYDEDGNYVFDKDKDAIKDEWLDGFDWDSVKQKAGNQWNKLDDDEEDEKNDVVETDGVGACERILKHLSDDKITSNDVLKNMNTQKKLTPAEERKRRWDAKKIGVEYKNDFSELANDLTGAVDDLVSLGHMDAYSMNRSQINELYEKLEIEKERADRAKRMKQLADEEARKQAEEVAKLETAEVLINDLMSDEEMDAEDEVSNNVGLNQIDGEASEIS